MRIYKLNNLKLPRVYRGINSINIEADSEQLITFLFSKRNGTVFLTLESKYQSISMPITIDAIGKIKQYFKDVVNSDGIFDKRDRIDYHYLIFERIGKIICCSFSSGNTLFCFSLDQSRYLYKFLERFFL